MNTPETCFESFFKALESKNLEAARACVLHASPDSRVDAMLGQFPNVHPSSVEIQSDGDTAEATFRIDENQAEPWHCRLKQSNGEWFFALDRSADELIADGVYQPKHSFDPVLAWFVYPDRFDDLMAAARADGEPKACLSHVRILAHGLLNLTASSQMQPTEDTWREAILPFLPNPPNGRDWFTCPTTGVPYSVNLAALTTRHPTTPLVYEGQNHQLSFPHHGKSAVAFTTGQASLVGPDQELTWP